MEAIKYLVIHCSATSPLMDIGKYEITEWHKARRFKTIGYHYVIRRDGTLEYGRNLQTQGAHVKGHNHYSVGICLVGGVDDLGHPEDNFTTLQYQELENLLRKLKQDFPNAIVQGHRDFPNVKKACPSFDVKSWWANISKEREQCSMDIKPSPLPFWSRFLGLWKRLTSHNS